MSDGCRSVSVRGSYYQTFDGDQSAHPVEGCRRCGESVACRMRDSRRCLLANGEHMYGDTAPNSSVRRLLHDCATRCLIAWSEMSCPSIHPRRSSVWIRRITLVLLAGTSLLSWILLALSYTGIGDRDWIRQRVRVLSFGRATYVEVDWGGLLVSARIQRGTLNFGFAVPAQRGTIRCWDVGVDGLLGAHRCRLGLDSWSFATHAEDWHSKYLYCYCGIEAPLWISGSFSVAMFLAVALRGAWIRAGRVLSGCCLQCGYDLTGSVSGNCPECGTRIGTDVRQLLWG